jgi:hypothetical protein
MHLASDRGCAVMGFGIAPTGGLASPQARGLRHGAGGGSGSILECRTAGFGFPEIGRASVITSAARMLAWWWSGDTMWASLRADRAMSGS